MAERKKQSADKKPTNAELKKKREAHEEQVRKDVHAERVTLADHAAPTVEKNWDERGA